MRSVVPSLLMPVLNVTPDASMRPPLRRRRRVRRGVPSLALAVAALAGAASVARAQGRGAALTPEQVQQRWRLERELESVAMIERKVMLYLAMHGTYGLTWILKDLLFPDPNWQRRATIASCVTGLLGLALYWLAGWLLISGTVTPRYPLPQGAWFCRCVSLCTFGCVTMMAADVQKSVTLQLERGLITSGMFRRVRHPNYLGEMLVYGSLAMMVWHWIPALVLAYYWLVMFATNMVMKEASMSRYPEWAAYRSRTWWLVPGVF